MGYPYNGTFYSCYNNDVNQYLLTHNDLLVILLSKYVVMKPYVWNDPHFVRKYVNVCICTCAYLKIDHKNTHQLVSSCYF